MRPVVAGTCSECGVLRHSRVLLQACWGGRNHAVLAATSPVQFHSSEQGLSTVSETTSHRSVELFHHHWLPDPQGPPGRCYISAKLHFVFPLCDFFGGSRGSCLVAQSESGGWEKACKVTSVWKQLPWPSALPSAADFQMAREGFVRMTQGKGSLRRQRRCRVSSSGSKEESCSARKALCSSARVCSSHYHLLQCHVCFRLL